MTSTLSTVIPDAVTRAPLGRLLMVGNFLSASVKTVTASEQLAEDLANAGWSVITTSPRINKITRMLDMMWTAWSRRHEYDVAQVAIFSGPAFLWAEATCAVLRLVGKPYILTLHGGNLPVFAQKAGGRIRRLLQSAQAVTAPSHFLQVEMERYRPGIQLIPNGVHMSAYQFRLRETAAPKLIWLRAFHRIYNPALAVEAVEILLRRFPQLQLLMVGREKDGTLAAVQQLVAKKGLQKHITFNPGVAKSDVPGLLVGSDIFLNTADMDNAPVSVVEAMACGLCVVSTNPGGISYLLEDGRDALVVPMKDAAAMAAAVERLIDEPALVQTLSAAARTKAETMDTGAVLDQWNTLLRSSLRERKAA